MLRYLPTKFSLILLISLAILAFFMDKTAIQSPFSEKNSKNSNSDKNFDYVIENFSTISVNHSSKAHYLISAEKMLRYTGDDATYLDQASLIDTTPGKSLMRVRADQAKLSGNNNDVLLNGNVVVLRPDENGNEMTMTTSFLHILPNDEIARTDKPVTITEKNTTINTTGIEIDDHNRITTLLSRVKVIHEKIR